MKSYIIPPFALDQYLNMVYCFYTLPLGLCSAPAYVSNPKCITQGCTTYTTYALQLLEQPSPCSHIHPHSTCSSISSKFKPLKIKMSIRSPQLLEPPACLQGSEALKSQMCHRGSITAGPRSVQSNCNCNPQTHAEPEVPAEERTVTAL